ncbi:rfaE bifunctional protein nucleotidyltransferase chain/domain [Catalinimonas alkaloidigena]|uniref:D-glycero-beta-D-manno-heptose 1-phosphate adenylyltransferase n=1 Tax=Catalinimonas alkaloidigena TaxID=1075417 RepID=UPI0024056BFE|nr:D-glycero-beta-D-manno-heptose 1-phosphate adenylyltransferase [Catalinimonas alkaloidigena]MDF9796637.1 rfaE bifunctional protein nucleotidyltransferase chain/domain [Catalinimonas alkaloidigena]
MEESKLYALPELLIKLDEERMAGKKIVFTNGCFDILHRGHATYLRKARSLGDLLVIGLNSDASVKRLKGESRPINNEDDRAYILESLECVNYVVKFGEDTPHELLSQLKPDILVKGGDYKLEDVVGREFAIEVVLIDFVDGYSTTKTIQQMKEKA